MTIFRCEHAWALPFVAGFALAWNAALFWFFKRGFIAIGNRQGQSGSTVIIYKDKTPFRFWVTWAFMLIFGNFVCVYAGSKLVEFCAPTLGSSQ